MVNIKNTKEIVDTIKKMLLLNTVYSIKEDSLLIKALDEKVFPYFINIFEMMIPPMKIFIDNYHNYIWNSSRLVDIILLLINKAKEEYKEDLKYQQSQ